MALPEVHVIIPDGVLANTTMNRSRNASDKGRYISPTAEGSWAALSPGEPKKHTLNTHSGNKSEYFQCPGRS